jgi:hypothetical protein
LRPRYGPSGVPPLDLALAAIRAFIDEHGQRPAGDLWAAARMRSSEKTIRRLFGSFGGRQRQRLAIRDDSGGRGRRLPLGRTIPSGSTGVTRLFGFGTARPPSACPCPFARSRQTLVTIARRRRRGDPSAPSDSIVFPVQRTTVTFRSGEEHHGHCSWIRTIS